MKIAELLISIATKAKEIKGKIALALQKISDKGGTYSGTGMNAVLEGIDSIKTGGGSSLALEQYFGMLDALGIEPIEDEEVLNTCESIWQEIQDSGVPTYTHQSTLMASVRVNKGDSALETLFPIPETIDIYSMSNIEVTNTLSTLWETING